jgi:Mrp family chromosome partitioning ATPase
VLIIASLVLGAFVALAAALFDEMRSPRVADVNEAERLSGLRVLSVAGMRNVPQERTRRAADRALPSALDPTADQYRMLAWHLTSPWPREGIVTVTGDRPTVAATVAANLAAVFAVEARSTLLVDADFSVEPVRHVLGLPKSPGLAAAIENRRKWSESLLTVPVGRSRTMDVLPSGVRDRPLGPAETQAAVADVLRAAQRHDATVVVATGPQGAKLRVGDDVVICAVRGVTRLATLARAVASLIDSGARVRGVVLWQGEEPQVTGTV